MAPDWKRDGVSLSELFKLFGRLDVTLVHAAVMSTSRSLGIRGTHLTFDETLRLLDKLALTDGAVGITARFVKARVLLIAAAEGETGSMP